VVLSLSLSAVPGLISATYTYITINVFYISVFVELVYSASCSLVSSKQY